MTQGFIFPMCQATGVTCMRLKIVRQSDFGTIIRQMYLVTVDMGS